MTFEIPLKITVRLITFDIDAVTGVQSIRDIKEQEVFLGSLPLIPRTMGLYGSGLTQLMTTEAMTTQKSLSESETIYRQFLRSEWGRLSGESDLTGFRYKITGVSLEFSGICPRCLSEKKLAQ